MSYLELRSLHVLVADAADEVGREVVKEFLNEGCNVTALFQKQISTFGSAQLFTIHGECSDERFVESCMKSARDRFGPINVLVANVKVNEDSYKHPMWETPLDFWEHAHKIDVRGQIPLVRHFLISARVSQELSGLRLENLTIIITHYEDLSTGGPTCVKCTSDKRSIDYSPRIMDDMQTLTVHARTNYVFLARVENLLLKQNLDGSKMILGEYDQTAFENVARPEHVARTIAFLASHRAAGHISGRCLRVTSDSKDEAIETKDEGPYQVEKAKRLAIHYPAASDIKMLQNMSKPSRRRVQIALSVDYDAISGWLGTGKHPDNNLADYSQGFFAGKIGAPRLLKLFAKLGVADKTTWFIPGHSMETFPNEVSQVVRSGCEIGLHGYCHEGAYQLTEEQERDVLEKCINLATELTGRKPVGYRAPLYQLRESTIKLLEAQGFQYDTSLSHHDSEPYFIPRHDPIRAPDFDDTKPASSWMHPTTINSTPDSTAAALVEIPCNWYMEDMTPLSFLPHTPNSHGYVNVGHVEQMWKDRFTWLWENGPNANNDDDGTGDFIFPIILHPDTSGMAHVIGMVERVLTWLRGWGDEVEFSRYEDIAREFRVSKTGSAFSKGA